MSEQPSKTFRLADQPTEPGVNLLRSRFRDDSASLAATAASAERDVQTSSEDYDQRLISSKPVAASGARRPRSFTAFRSAAEEVTARKDEDREDWPPRR